MLTSRKNTVLFLFVVCSGSLIWADPPYIRSNRLTHEATHAECSNDDECPDLTVCNRFSDGSKRCFCEDVLVSDDNGHTCIERYNYWLSGVIAAGITFVSVAAGEAWYLKGEQLSTRKLGMAIFLPFVPSALAGVLSGVTVYFANMGLTETWQYFTSVSTGVAGAWAAIGLSKLTAKALTWASHRIDRCRGITRVRAVNF